MYVHSIDLGLAHSAEAISTSKASGPAGDAIFLLRDHDILHVGWNLALMDHLNMERFPSLREHWG